VGKGSGMGLAICYQIVKKHQGKIEVTSEAEKGTEFAITLPIQTEAEMAISA
jgi:signal transduction histidine kinase